MIRKPIIVVMGHIDAGKCVSGDTEVFLADGTTPKIKDLFDKFEEKSKKIIDEDGIALELNPYLMNLGEENGHIKPVLISHIWKLKKTKLIETTLKNGFKVKTTPEHPFLVLDDNLALCYKQAKDVLKNDFIAVPNKIPATNPNEAEIKSLILEKLAQNSGLLAFVDDNFAAEFSPLIRNSDKSGLLTKQVRDCIEDKRFRVNDLLSVSRKNGLELGKVYDSIKFVKYSTTKQRASHRGSLVRLPKEKSEFKEFFYVLGLIWGDGCGSDLRLSNNDDFLLEKYRDFFENVMKVKSIIKQGRTSKDAFNHGWKTMKELLFTLFELPNRKKSHLIKFPELMQRMPNEFISEFLSGYFDTDGYIDKNSRVEISTVSKEMAKDLTKILTRFWIIPSINPNRKSYRVTISGKRNITNFIEKIGFKLERKKQLLAKSSHLCETNRASDILPFSGEKLRLLRIELCLNGMETKIPYQRAYEKYSALSVSYLSKFIESANKTVKEEKYRQKLESRTFILDLLKTKKTYNKVYSQLAIEHKILLNELLWMNTDKLILKEGKYYSTTPFGNVVLGKWTKINKVKYCLPLVLENISSILQSDLRFVKVKEKTEIENNEEFVYDLTQPKTHNFIANGIIIHNTKLLDSIRGTAIADREAGGITQHIGATEVPISLVKKISGNLIEKYRFNIVIPGLLFIDTPGHEAFTNLRKRGGSIADLAILVVDIGKGLERQTIEAIDILKSYKVPFIVVANKVDNITGFYAENGSSITESLGKQDRETLGALDTKIYELVGQLSMHGFSSERFDNVKDFTKEIIIIPASAKKSIGIPEILMFLAGMSQKYLEKKLSVSQSSEARGTVLEVKEEKGIGKTIDVILYDGVLCVGDEIVVGGKAGPIRAKVRALLEPKPLNEAKNQKDIFRNVKEVHAAAGVKISAPGLEDVLSGSPLRHFSQNAEKEVQDEIKTVRIDSDAAGVTIKADTLGSLEALTRLLSEKGIKASSADVGPVSHRDVMKAHAVMQKDQFSGVILAFNVLSQPQTADEAKKLDVKIFSEKIIYKIIENYTEWVENEKKRQRKEKLETIIMPFSVKVLKNHIFRASKPAVAGVRVEAGRLKQGIELLNNGEVIGRIREIQLNGKNVPEAKKGDEVAISIEGGVAGKNFKEDDTLYSFIPKRQFEALEEMSDSFDKEEVFLIKELKEILNKKTEDRK